MKNENPNKFIEKLNHVSKLNKITLLLIVVLYIALAGTVGFLISKDPVYKVTEKENEIFGEKVNVSTIIFNLINQSTDDEDNKEYNSKYYIYTLSDALGDEKYSNVKYDLTVMTGKKNYVYFDRMTFNVPFSSTSETSTRNTITVSDSSTSNGKKTKYSYNCDEITNEGISKIFGNVRYTYKNDDNIQVVENNTFSRDILTLKSKELKNAVSDEEVKEFELEFYISSTQSDAYQYVLRLKSFEKSVAHKIDMQSFVETIDGTIIPLCGVYNFSDDDTLFTTLNKYKSSESKIYKSLGAKNIYVKTRIYTSINEYQEVLIKYNFNDIINK